MKHDIAQPVHRPSRRCSRQGMVYGPRLLRNAYRLTARTQSDAKTEKCTARTVWYKKHLESARIWYGSNVDGFAASTRVDG